VRSPSCWTRIGRCRYRHGRRTANGGARNRKHRIDSTGVTRGDYALVEPELSHVANVAHQRTRQRALGHPAGLSRAHFAGMVARTPHSRAESPPDSLLVSWPVTSWCGAIACSDGVGRRCVDTLVSLPHSSPFCYRGRSATPSSSQVPRSMPHPCSALTHHPYRTEIFFAAMSPHSATSLNGPDPLFEFWPPAVAALAC